MDGWEWLFFTLLFMRMGSFLGVYIGAFAARHIVYCYFNCPV